MSSTLRPFPVPVTSVCKPSAGGQLHDGLTAGACSHWQHPAGRQGSVQRRLVTTCGTTRVRQCYHMYEPSGARGQRCALRYT